MERGRRERPSPSIRSRSSRLSFASRSVANRAAAASVGLERHRQGAAEPARSCG